MLMLITYIFVCRKKVKVNKPKKLKINKIEEKRIKYFVSYVHFKQEEEDISFVFLLILT